MPATPEELLKSVFGYDAFKPLQREVIENVLMRQDSLVIMPTGSGKSLCYQIPALIFPGLTVVVSPLIALMKDQVEQLQALGVAAVFLNSSLPQDLYRENMDRVRTGKVKLLYVAPETLLTERILHLLKAVPFDCLAIDEAHCISEWGHDFRPEYRQLAEVRQRFPQVTCLALTASATERVRSDIQTSLGFAKQNAFLASFDRENLLIEVLPKKKKPFDQLLALVRKHRDQSGIIYCFSRKQVDDLSAALAQAGFSVRPYHAGLEDADRRANQEAFIRDDVQIMVATIAFGMGINKPNVRYVIHYDLPKSVESYYQEIGRAGRDGLPSHCVLLYSYGDVAKWKYFLDQKDGLERKVAYQHLAAMTQYAEWTACRRISLLAYFGEQFEKEDCGMCDNCRNDDKNVEDITIPVQKFLSCVVRSGEMFGAQHVVDVLLGQKTEKVTRHGHDNLSTFGIGTDLTREQWLFLSRQLVQKGLMAQDAQYGSLRMTETGYEILRSRAPMHGKLAEARTVEEIAGRKRAAEQEYDRSLFEKLRALRKQVADEENVPPYVIFADRTLIEMSAYLPTEQADLRQIFGVGTVKLARYGERFLEAIQQYSRETGKEGHYQPAVAKRESRTPAQQKQPRFLEVGDAYNAGETILALAQRYGVKTTTIIDHLTECLQQGHTVRVGDDLAEICDLPEERQTLVLQAFRQVGVKLLKPAYDLLDGQVDYDQLKQMRLVFLLQRRTQE